MIVTKEMLDGIFGEAKTADDYILALYQAVVPDFNQQERVSWAKCGRELWLDIAERAMAFDRGIAAGFPGSLWMNYGFSVKESLRPREAVAA